MPGHRVFGTWYKMINYHYEHPLAFIAIPCFFYGIIATTIRNGCLTPPLKRQIAVTISMLIVVMFFSSIFGGMLWHYYDMKVGYFPVNWLQKILIQGALNGLKMGWLIILLSFPYNLLSAVTLFFLTKKGNELYP